MPDPLATGNADRAPGPLRVSARNPRYFTDESGKAIYLTGSHTWDVLQRWFCGVDAATFGHPEIGRASRPADLGAYLDLLQANNHNFARLWVADTAWSPITRSAIEPQPYLRTGPGNAADGRPRFDLNRLNQAYFDALRACVVAGRQRGIYVSVMLFDSWGIGEQSEPTWKYHPLCGGNNINGIDGDGDHDGIGTGCSTWQNPAIRALQEAYIRKVVDTVRDLDNVLYEVANETGEYSTAWQYGVIRLIRSYEATLTTRVHPVGMTFQYSALGSGSNANLFDGPADWVSPAGPAYRSDPPAARGDKVVITDTDHIDPTTTSPDWVWRCFLRGHNPIVMDWWSGAAWEPIRRAMGRTHAYAQRIDLVAMTPREELSTTAYCLASPGAEYLAYQPRSGAFSLTLAAGTYAVEWFDLESETTSTADAVTVASGSHVFTPPRPGPSVLYLKR